MGQFLDEYNQGSLTKRKKNGNKRLGERKLIFNTTELDQWAIEKLK